MNKKTTLIVFYSIIALICTGVLALVNLIVLPSLNAKGKKTEEFINIGTAQQDEWFPIEKDLIATNQAGQEVKLSDLRGKVWIIAEFFAVCPHCAVRNGKELRELYDEFKDHPDFHIVCISVDPKADHTEKLRDYGAALGADVKNWWFLNAGDEKATHEYLEKNLKFLAVRERTDPVQIEANGRFEHDMGKLAIGRDFSVFGKWDLAFQRSEMGTQEGYEKAKQTMFERIRIELDKK